MFNSAQFSVESPNILLHRSTASEADAIPCRCDITEIYAENIFMQATAYLVHIECRVQDRVQMTGNGVRGMVHRWL